MKKLYLAPMEEVTGYVFRNVFARHYKGVDKFFTPFITPDQNNLLKTREGRELHPSHNNGLYVVPQILTNNYEHFNNIIPLIKDLGYEEINLNFGCPSNTVAKKFKGSGILRDLDLLDRFLDGVFRVNTDIKISVKTRLGYDTAEYFDEVVNIYNKYPLYELIIHPRIQKDFYKGEPRMECFEMAARKSCASLCYNGNIFTKEDAFNIENKYPNIDSIMIGRGAIMNLTLFEEISNLNSGIGETTNLRLKKFLDDLYETYCAEYSVQDALFKMKEIWSYLINSFPDKDKDIKTIRKTREPAEYKAAVRSILKE